MSIPQIIKILRTKDVQGVSAFTFVLIEITGLCFLIRSIVIRECTLSAYYFVIVLASAIQLIHILKYRKRCNSIDGSACPIVPLTARISGRLSYFYNLLGRIPFQSQKIDTLF
ncbi:PQ-loop repeat-containing protein [candidate division WOR-3 bacterium]|nr:PQ-loop repeat-containing protein [candidate division WOR-3 bacterium]